MPDDIDQIAVVVDWLDACRRRDLEAVLGLYAPDASLECQCEGTTVSEGRVHLARYWEARLDSFVPNAFGLEEIAPVLDGVQLDYVSHQGLPVRMMFSFSADGKISRARCEPCPEPARPDVASLQDTAG